MREFREGIQDEKLSDDLKGIIGQESHHAVNFERWTAEMNKRYASLSNLSDRAKDYFLRATKERSKKFKIGLTAGYETFTFTGGLIILQRYRELMEDADPTLRALCVWHQVEEVEHGSVAFDFYKYFYPKDEWYRRWMTRVAYLLIVREPGRTLSSMTT